MNKEFIPYEQALELIKLGFDEKCIAWYPNDSAALSIDGVYLGERRSGSYKLLAYAPLYQQAFRWFREKYKENVIYSRLIYDYEMLQKHYKIMDLGNPLVDDNEKQIIEDVISSEVEHTKIVEFLNMYNEDGLGHTLKNVDYWIRNTFATLNSFK